MDRREFVAAAGSLAATLSGCATVDRSDPPFGGPDEPLEPVDGTWPTFQFDDGRTGYNPDPGTPHGDRDGGWSVAMDTSGTPAVADGTVYVGSIEGYVSALDATTGEERWRFDTGVERDATFWATPVPAGETLYAHGDAGVYALERSSGEMEWRVEPEVESLRPRTVAVVDGTVYVERAGTAVAALDAGTGDEQWRYDAGDYGVQSPLAFADDTVYLSAVDSTVHAIDAETGERRWREVVAEGRFRGLAVSGGTLFLTSHVVYALDAESGDRRWSFDVRKRATLDACPDGDRQSGSGGSPASQPAVAGGTLFVRFEGCHVLALTTESGELAWTADVAGTRVAPAVVDDLVYVAGDGRVVALDASSGERAGPTFSTRWRPSTSPVVVDGVVFVGAEAEDRAVLAAATG